MQQLTWDVPNAFQEEKIELWLLYSISEFMQFYWSAIVLLVCFPPALLLFLDLVFCNLTAIGQGIRK